MIYLIAHVLINLFEVWRVEGEKGVRILEGQSMLMERSGTCFLEDKLVRI
jgi:streptomycin 6-kinase